MEIIGKNISEREQRSKNMMKIIIIILVILLLISIILGITIYFLKSQQFKFVVNGKNVAEPGSDVFIYQGENIYVSIKDIAPIIDYKYYNGSYRQYTEDLDKCYVECTDEVCTLEKDSNKIYKTSTKELDYQYLTLEEPIRKINGKLYATIKDMQIICNTNISYNKQENKMTIYTLPYLVNYYTLNNKKSSITNNFNNQKALLYGLLVSQNVDNTLETEDVNYGVYALDGTTEIIGTKYKKIEFIESMQEFIVTTLENKVGIITSDGDTKVRPQYDSLKQIDKDLNLYLATNNNKKGIIEKNGKILIYLEYDEIGIDATEFPNNDIKNSYLLFNSVIPVKQNGKWGMYDIKGNLVLPIEYENFGCVNKNKTDRNLNNILIIPDIQSIVVSKIYKIEKEYNGRKIIDDVELYGIVNIKGQEYLEPCLETIYSITNNGREEYTMIYNGTSYDVIDYIRKYVLQENQKNNLNTNSISNTLVTNEI